MVYFRYIALHYLKYFSVILTALIFFVVGFDYMEHADSLPDSANLLLLYFMYVAFAAIDMLLPISLVFAMISTKIFLIRSNALVALYSLGYSKTDILKPFFTIAASIVVVFILLHATTFAKAQEYASSIRKNAHFSQPTSNMFFTFSDQYIFFGNLYPLQKRAEDIRIFRMKNNILYEVVVAKSAAYRKKYWYIDKADLMRIPDNIAFGEKGIVLDEQNNLKLLKGFKPRILDQVYEGKANFTIQDAVVALLLLHDQNVNIDNIKSALYKIFVYPFFAPFLVIIIFFFVPISSRFLNLTLFSFGAILSTLLSWGIMFLLIRLSNLRTIPGEVGIVLPVFILFAVAVHQMWRSERRQ
jgi:lipopolysaccharide export system permease protein